jgi:hypothetical protein
MNSATVLEDPPLHESILGNYSTRSAQGPIIHGLVADHGSLGKDDVVVAAGGANLVSVRKT